MENMQNFLPYLNKQKPVGCENSYSWNMYILACAKGSLDQILNYL